MKNLLLILFVFAFTVSHAQYELYAKEKKNEKNIIRISKGSEVKVFCYDGKTYTGVLSKVTHGEIILICKSATIFIEDIEALKIIEGKTGVDVAPDGSGIVINPPTGKLFSTDSWDWITKY